jgi:IS30 family transposase
MSPRAAWRLESLGFREVYDYVAGKLDWMAAGLPTERTNAAHPRAGDVSRKDVPTARLEERLGDVRERVSAGGWDAVVVTNNERVVLGLLRSRSSRRTPTFASNRLCGRDRAHSGPMWQSRRWPRT